jgi:hypothetical protein
MKPRQDRITGQTYLEHGRPVVVLIRRDRQCISPRSTKGRAAFATRIASILEDHGWLRRFHKPVEIDGMKRRDAWEVIRP